MSNGTSLFMSLLVALSSGGEQILIFSDSVSLFMLAIRRRDWKPTQALALRLTGPDTGKIWAWLEWPKTWVELLAEEGEIRRRGLLLASADLHSLVTLLMAEWRDYATKQGELSASVFELSAELAEYKRVSYNGFAEKPLRPLLPPNWQNVVVVSGVTSRTIPLAEYPLRALPGFSLHFYLPSALPREIGPREIRPREIGPREIAPALEPGPDHLPRLSGVGIPLRDNRGNLLGEVSFQGETPVVFVSCPVEGKQSGKAKRSMRAIASALDPILRSVERAKGFEAERVLMEISRREIDILRQELSALCGAASTSPTSVSELLAQTESDLALAGELGL